MSARKTYWVQHKNSRWHVAHSGLIISSHNEKAHAIDAGAGVAAINQPSELLICLVDGKIDDTRTYGADPVA